MLWSSECGVVVAAWLDQDKQHGRTSFREVLNLRQYNEELVVESICHSQQATRATDDYYRSNNSNFSRRPSDSAFIFNLLLLMDHHVND
jgi:predicted acyl esterase